MDIFEAVQFKALRDVHKGNDPEYFLRRLYRWYSINFHVPLTEVDSIPITVILQNYFENYYEGLTNEKRLKEINKLFLNTEEIEKEQDAIAAEDEKFVKQLSQDVKKENEKRKLDKSAVAAAREKNKNQNVIQRLGNSPAADALKRFMAEADSLNPRKK